MIIKYLDAGELVDYLSKFGNLKKAFDTSYTDYYWNNPCTVRQHAIISIGRFDENILFNEYQFPDSLLGYEQFRIMLALHDTGMEKVNKKKDIWMKFGYSRENIQWLLSQPVFIRDYSFTPQEEKVALALVRDDPLWQYMANNCSSCNAAERICKMAVEAGIEPDSADFFNLYVYEIIYFICDLGYYDHLQRVESDNNKRLIFKEPLKTKIAQLTEIIQKITLGAIPFSEPSWKPIQYKYLTTYAKQNRLKLRSGDMIKGDAISYRFNISTGYYEIKPQKLPSLYDPNY